MEINQYNIVLVNFDKSLGSEIQKTRPCVVISPDQMNRYLQTIVVAPMTTRSRNYPTRKWISHDLMMGWIVVDQIQTIDRSCINRIVGALTMAEIRKLKNVIKEAFVD